MSFERILVPVDYSPHSKRALELALSLQGARTVHAVHVWDRPAYVSDEMVVHTGDARRSLSELIRENAQREMTDFLSQLVVPPGVDLQQQLVPGDPVAALLELVTSGDYQLLVVGTHGRTGMTRLLLGSVTEKLVRLSPIPVLTVPPVR